MEHLGGYLSNLCFRCEAFVLRVNSCLDPEIFGVYTSSKLAWQAGKSPCVKNPISSSIQVHFRVSHVSFFQRVRYFKTHGYTIPPPLTQRNDSTRAVRKKPFWWFLTWAFTMFMTKPHIVLTNIWWIYIYRYICGWIISNPPPCSNLEPFLLKHQVLNLTLPRDSYKVGPKSADEMTQLISGWVISISPQWNPLVYFRPLIGDMIYIYISKFGYMKMYLYIYITLQ